MLWRLLIGSVLVVIVGTEFIVKGCIIAARQKPASPTQQA
jgi:hypothetical protein